MTKKKAVVNSFSGKAVALKSVCTFSAFSQVLTRENRVFWWFKSSWISNALIAMAAIFLQRAESSFTTTRASGAKNRPLWFSSRF